MSKNIFYNYVFAFVVFLVLSAFSVHAQTTTFNIEIPNESLFGGKFMGFGAELDPFFWNTPNTNPSVIDNPRNIQGVNDADWQIVTQRMKDMKIPIVRMMMQLGWATRDPNLGSWNWNDPIMQSVFKYLDFACANNIDVIIDDWAWTARGWNESGVSLYQDETDTRYALGIAEYLKYFIETKGYSCIKYLIIANEPEYEFGAGNNRTYSQVLSIYETMIRNVQNALVAQGIRSKIKFIGPDMGGDWQFYYDAIRDLNGIFDLYDFHRYPGPTCDYPQPPCSAEITNNYPSGPPGGIYGTLYRMLEEMRNGAVNNDAQTGRTKQVIATEMGIASGDTFSAAGKNDYFEYGLEIADYATTMISSPIQGGILWNMFDLYYSSDQNIYFNPPFYDANFFQWGLWKYKDSNWALRPPAHAWALVSKFAVPGSVQARINGYPSVTSLPPISPYRVGALMRPDGGWNIFLINETKTGTTFNLQFPSTPVYNFSQYRFDRNTFLNYPNVIAIPPIGTMPASKNLSVSMPSESFTVLVENNPVTPTLTPACKSGDINCDGLINIKDLVSVIVNYAKSGIGDLNSDNKINGLDLGVLIGNWGI